MRVGESLQLSGLKISDADMGDGTKWMTLLVRERGKRGGGRCSLELGDLDFPTGVFNLLVP